MARCSPETRNPDRRPGKRGKTVNCTRLSPGFPIDFNKTELTSKRGWARPPHFILRCFLATTIKINLEFISAVGATTSFSDSISPERDASEDGKSNLAGEVFAELRKCAGYADHVAQLPSIRDLLKTESSFTYEATDVGDVVNLFNVPAVWLELVNTFTNLRYVLAQARSYKDLEPPQTSPENNASCAYLHFQKMYSLNLAALDLAKIQDLVIRLLYESFSGKLIRVDLDDSEWEKKLTLNEAKKGLKEKLDNKEINRSEAFVDYMKHLAKMLEALRAIPRLC